MRDALQRHHRRRRDECRESLRKSLLLAIAAFVLLGHGPVNTVIGSICLIFSGLHLHEWWCSPYPHVQHLPLDDDQRDAARAWCRANIRGRWRDHQFDTRHHPQQPVSDWRSFTFAREQDAALFKMFWD